jgi:hypothetical protein
MARTLLLLRRWPITPSHWATFLPTWLTCAVQVSCVSRIVPRYRAVSTQCTDSENWTGLGLWMCLAVLATSIAVLCETLIAIVQSRGWARTRNGCSSCKGRLCLVRSNGRGENRNEGRYLPSFRAQLTHRPNDGGSKLLWNVGQYLPDYTVLHPRRQPSSYSSPWEPRI